MAHWEYSVKRFLADEGSRRVDETLIRCWMEVSHGITEGTAVSSVQGPVRT